MLDLQVLRFLSGRSEPRLLEGRQELLYIASGSGRLHLGGESHMLEPDTAALLLPGESYEIETNSGLELVSVSAPAAAL